jgi:hypothetical protein
VSELHRVIGFLVVGIFSIGWLFGFVLWVSRRPAGDWFWRWLTAAQVVALVQALGGVALLAIGRRPLSGLHIVYGLGPLVIFVIAHLLAREEAFESKPWAPFALAAFIAFGLSLRAVMTGLGTG